MHKIGIVVLSLMFAFGSANAATQIKIATLVPKASSWGTKIDEARAAIKEQTDGRVILKVYYGGVQGHSAKVKQKIKIGQLHGGDFTPTDFQDKMPDLNLYGLPFVFDSLDEVAYVRERMDEVLSAGFEEQGFVAFGFAGDFAIILSNNPVRGLDDMKGRKVWLPEGDNISDQALKRLQLVPNSKPISDVMTGLKTGLFDVVAIPPAAAVALQWHTAVKYLTDMPVIYAMQFMAIQKRVFDKLSAEDQAVVREVLTRVYAEINEQAPIDAANARDALANSGITIVEPNAGEFEQIQKIMAENNRDMAKQGLFSLELLETMQRHIDEFHTGQVSSADTVAADDQVPVATGSQ
jgi:TRAP-type C4-dicarboxylate transport system substrate-binding protein